MFNSISTINRTCLLLLFMFLVIGCSKQTTFNGFSPEHFKESLLTLTEDIPSKDRESLIEDLRLLNEEKRGVLSSIDEPDLAFLTYINGKSVRDIKNDAQNIRNAAEAERRQAAEDRRQSEINKVKGNIDYLRSQRSLILEKREELLTKLEKLKLERPYDPDQSLRSGGRIGPGLHAILSGQTEVENQIETLNNQYQQIESQILDSCGLLKNKYAEDC